MTDDLERVLRDTLADPRRSISAWPDPLTRIRRVAAARRRRRIGTAAGVAAVAMVAALVPAVRDQQEDDGAAGPRPVPSTAAATRIATIPLLGDPRRVVVDEEGWVWVLTVGQQNRRINRVNPATAIVDETSFVDVPESADVVAALGSVWATRGSELVRIAGETGRELVAFPGDPVEVVAHGPHAWVATEDGQVHKADLRTGTVEPAGHAGPHARLTVDAETGAVWVFGGDREPRSVASLEPAGPRIPVPGVPAGAPIAAGGGRVYVATNVAENYLTSGQIVPVDLGTRLPRDPWPSPVAFALAYTPRGLWVAGVGIGRLDPYTGAPLGSPVEGVVVREMAVAENGDAWVATAAGLVRYRA